MIPRRRLNWSEDPVTRFAARGADWRSTATKADANAALRYNRSLYGPDSTALRAVTTPPPRFSRAESWQGPAAPVRAGNYVSRYGTASVTGGSAPIPSSNIAARYNTGGAAGPSGSAGEPQSDGYVPGMPTGYRAPAVDTAPRAQRPGVPPPAGNAAQRWAGDDRAQWQADGGSNQTFNRANVALGIRPRIDARTTQANPSQNKNFVSQRPDMDSNRPAKTWDQRQQSNSARERAVIDARGLPY